jgi:[ribosomal protein S18]-alanine N-acetyltransferase
VNPEALARVHAEVFTIPRPWTAAEFGAFLETPGSFLLTEGEAFLVGRAVAGEAELLTLAVPVPMRRQGVGRRLVAEFEAEAAARGAQEAFLEVAASNAAARALYRAAGWSEAGRRRGYYAFDGGEDDALVLAKAPLRTG